MAIECDLAVLGAGPGGYPGSDPGQRSSAPRRRASRQGPVGGTCLNVGCIPTKAMVQSAHGYHEAREPLAPLGIKVDGVTLDFAAGAAQPPAASWTASSRASAGS